MAAKHTSRLFACAAIGVTVAAVAVNGCSSDSGSRDAGGAGPDTGAGVDGMTGLDTGTGDDTGSDTGGFPGDTGGDTTAASGVCILPSPLPPKGLIYNGGVMGQVCPNNLDPTNYPNGTWFPYDDKTDGGTFSSGPQPGGAGCDPRHPCAYHVSGQGHTGYGGGVGFQLLGGTPIAMPFDASQYGGLQLWLKGTTSGTRGLSYAQADNTVHVKFVTGALDSSVDPRAFDDYGAYCSTQPGDGGPAGDWVSCPIPFGSLKRDGFAGVEAGAPDPTMDTFDPQNLIKIEFELSAYTPPADSGIQNVVSFDVWIDDIAWMPHP
jgi:hypothetical protein